MSKTEQKFWENDDWNYLETDRVVLFSVVTHEMRSSLSKEQLAPFARIDDGKMAIMGVNSRGKISILKFLSKM